MEARIDLHADPLMRTERLWLFDRVPDGTIFWTPPPPGAEPGTITSVWRWELHRHDAGIMLEPPHPLWIDLPAGGWDTIVNLAAPGPHAGELQAVREALEVERRRVDQVLEHGSRG